MHYTPEEAKTKLCIHKRAITPDGKCVANECMGWKSVNRQVPFDGPDDPAKLSAGQPFKVIPTGKGYCCYFR